MIVSWLSPRPARTVSSQSRAALPPSHPPPPALQLPPATTAAPPRSIRARTRPTAPVTPDRPGRRGVSYETDPALPSCRLAAHRSRIRMGLDGKAPAPKFVLQLPRRRDQTYPPGAGRRSGNPLREGGGLRGEGLRSGAL